jgi:hypothetical protein
MKTHQVHEWVEIPKKHLLKYEIDVLEEESLIRWSFRTKKRGILLGLAYKNAPENSSSTSRLTSAAIKSGSGKKSKQGFSTISLYMCVFLQ